MCLGLEPGAAAWKEQTNPLSYGGTPGASQLFWRVALFRKYELWVESSRKVTRTAAIQVITSSVRSVAADKNNLIIVQFSAPPASCIFTICKSSSDVCRIRLDLNVSRLPASLQRG